MHFYDGHKFEDFLDMTQVQYNIMLESMRRIQAKNILIWMDCAQYPHMSDMKEKRKKHREYYKAAFPENFENKVVSNDELRLV